ncbi:MAG: hypothetical protein LUP95_04685 [Euryarchaeota archaeon]|nr:hypothetical protein [Euryarchaeota archaeon]
MPTFNSKDEKVEALKMTMQGFGYGCLVGEMNGRMKQIALGFLLLSVIASVLTAGCTNPITNTAPSPTPAVASNTTWLEEKIASLPLIESVNPLRRVSDDPSGLETYKGTYLVSEAGGREYISTWTFQTTDSDVTAKLHYQQLVRQKMDEGYKEGRPVEVPSTLLGNVTSSWYGAKNHNQAQAMYGYNYELADWWVLSVTGLPESVLIGDI